MPAGPTHKGHSAAAQERISRAKVHYDSRAERRVSKGPGPVCRPANHPDDCYDDAPCSCPTDTHEPDCWKRPRA